MALSSSRPSPTPDRIVRPTSRPLPAGGGYAHGRPPYGWRAEGGRLVEDEAEQATVDRIGGLRRQGKSLRAVAAALEGEGHRPREGDRWHPNTLARILERLDAS